MSNNPIGLIRPLGKAVLLPRSSHTHMMKSKEQTRIRIAPSDSGDAAWTKRCEYRGVKRE